MTDIKFAHKELWTSRRQDFAVEVSLHQTNAEHGEGPYRWSVYAYIYPQHWLFGKFDGEAIYQEATKDIPLHCGCSYCHWHIHKSGAVASIQVGADYHHLNDHRFTFYATENDAVEVFCDAKQLFKWLESKPAEVNNNVFQPS